MLGRSAPDPGGIGKGIDQMTMDVFRRTAALLAVMAVSLGVSARGFGESAPPTPEERWYVLEMEGARAGWMVERSAVTPNGNRRDETELSISVARMGQTIEILIKTGTLESPEGKVLEMRSAQNLGMASTNASYIFEDDHVVCVKEQLGRTTRETIPVPEGSWLSPSAVSALIEQKLAEGATEFSYTTLDATNSLATITAKHTVIGRGTVEAEGKTVPALEWVLTNSLLPGVETREFVDEKTGATIRSEIDFGGISLSVLRSEKEFALAKLDAPELMASVLVHPDKPIPNPRTVRRGVYTLRSTGEALPDIPSMASQRFERIDATSGRLTVDIDDLGAGTEADIADPRLTRASSAADINDPEIRALVDNALANKRFADQRAVAEYLTTVVRDHITDNSLGVGFATASETCRTKEGDCSEHAVLLAAAIRAAGIPSRAVSGLVYVDQFVGTRQVFGYHMWTQALVTIDGTPRWIDLDAAVYPMDATHIALASSTLADDDMLNSMVTVADVMGQLAIEVEEIEVAPAVPSTPE